MENECTNSNLVCTKCHGNYKASEEHCCISTLRARIDAQAAVAADDRSSVNDIFENFNNHVQSSLRILQQRCDVNQQDTQSMLEAVIGLNSQVASFQSSKLGEIAQSAASKLQQSQEVRIPESANFSFKLATPLQGPKTECRKIPVQGAQTGKYFEYPEI